MTRQLFTIILIITFQIIGLITFDILDWNHLYDMVAIGCPASLIMLALLNMLNNDIMYWFSQPLKKSKK